MLFKGRLLGTRQTPGLTQKALADKAGTSMLTDRNYERGTRLAGLKEKEPRLLPFDGTTLPFRGDSR